MVRAKGFEIGEVFCATGSALVRFELFAADYAYFDFVHKLTHEMLRHIRPGYPIYRGEKIDSERRHTPPQRRIQRRGSRAIR